MMEAFAIKGLYGIEANTVRDSAAECWSDWLIESELTHDVSKARGYRCVPVQIIDGWIPASERSPEDDTPVLILFRNGDRNIGEIRLDSPGFEDSYQAFRYWDSPTDDGKVWEWGDITHWMPLPQPPKAPK